jgi:hypothetical protein
VGKDGAVRVNMSGGLVLQEQAAGYSWIRYAVLYQNPDYRRLGWKILDWGLGQQNEAGGFESKDAVHETTWFLEALATSMAIDPMGVTPARRLGLARGIAWLNESNRRRHVFETSATFTHRCWMRASLYQSSSLLLGESRYEDYAAEWARQGLAQQVDGVFPERGGPDVGYQILGIQYLERYLAMIGHMKASRSVRAGLLSGLGWYKSKISAGGIIDRAGSTRMRVEMDKDVRYSRAIEVCVGASLLTGDLSWVQTGFDLERGAISEKQAGPSALLRFGSGHTGAPSGLINRDCSICHPVSY